LCLSDTPGDCLCANLITSEDEVANDDIHEADVEVEVGEDNNNDDAAVGDDVPQGEPDEAVLDVEDSVPESVPESEQRADGEICTAAGEDPYCASGYCGYLATDTRRGLVCGPACPDRYNRCVYLALLSFQQDADGVACPSAGEDMYCSSGYCGYSSSGRLECGSPCGSDEGQSSSGVCGVQSQFCIDNTCKFETCALGSCSHDGYGCNANNECQLHCDESTGADCGSSGGSVVAPSLSCTMGNANLCASVHPEKPWCLNNGARTSCTSNTVGDCSCAI